MVKDILAGKPAVVFKSSGTQHDGQETTIISTMLTLFHHGCILIGLPYTVEEQSTIAEITGINKKNIEVVVTSKNISICGETETNIKKDKEVFVKKERGYSKLCRYLKFPEDINPNNMEAMLNNGILQININKKNTLKKGIIVLVK